MPRYFFHLCHSGRCSDPEGTELSGGLAEIREEACHSARELMADAVMQGRDISGHRFEVEDEEGTIVFTMALREALSAVH
jgi:hypothetical protein